MWDTGCCPNNRQGLLEREPYLLIRASDRDEGIAAGATPSVRDVVRALSRRATLHSTHFLPIGQESAKLAAALWHCRQRLTR